MMKKIDTHDPETQSPDLIAENVVRLKELFPEAWTEGKVDFEALKQLLGGVVDEREEKYGLNWHGKRQARQLALMPSTGTLRPAPEESVDWETTRNLVIEGDNLEVLKLFQKTYTRSIKLIYIDPPYNTGSDFVYPDDYRDGVSNYLAMTRQADADAKRSSNTEASGRFHTKWLSMMYPRLALAKNLLRDDGVLIASIDDAELPRLRSILDEIFGEENFAAVLVWDRARKNDARFFSVGHEYMVVYFKSAAFLADNHIVFRGAKEGVGEVKMEFDRLRRAFNDEWPAVQQGLVEFYATISDDDPRAPMKRFTKVDKRGPFRDDGNINWPGGDGPRYEIRHPHTGIPCKLPTSGWRYPTPTRFWEEFDKGRIVFGPDHTTVPRVRTNLFENADQVMASVHFSYAQTSANQFNSLFGGQRVFDNPKPVDDLQRLVSYLTNTDDLVLDFFAGSGTTGHAVLLQNARDAGQRRFILVQLPQPLDPDSSSQKAAADLCRELGVPSNLSEITKERLRRAGKKVREASPMFATDVGFRVFRLASSNIASWVADPHHLEQSLLDSVDHIVSGRGEADILYEILLKVGLDLCISIERKNIGGKIVYSVGGGVLLVCLAESISTNDVESLAQGIVNWRTSLAPAGDSKCVFRDSAFADDVAKTNLAAILEQHGLTNVRSL